MPHVRTEELVTGAEAFRHSHYGALHSQAAFLLLVGRQLRGDDAAWKALAQPLFAAPVEAAVGEDLERFPVPSVRPTGERFHSERITSNLTRRYGRRIPKRIAPVKEFTALAEPLADLAERFRQAPSPLAAAELMGACLRHPHELVRVAGAASSVPVTFDVRYLLRLLQTGAKSDDPLVRALAATALGRLAPDDPVLRRLVRPGARAAASAPAHTSLIVHGTWARSSPWWQPGGDFHTYLLNNVAPDLYNAADAFAWSGGYSDAARLLGAEDLVAWANAHAAHGLNLYAHSHGGNVAFLATHGGLTIGELVLLSCPVRIPQYVPDFAQTNKVVSIRVHLDLVILVDGAGQHFPFPQIQEHVLPIWFDHFATHDPAVWQEHNVPGML